jgi:hypothetical protein
MQHQRQCAGTMMRTLCDLHLNAKGLVLASGSTSQHSHTLLRGDPHVVKRKVAVSGHASDIMQCVLTSFAESSAAGSCLRWHVRSTDSMDALPG